MFKSRLNCSVTSELPKELVEVICNKPGICPKLRSKGAVTEEALEAAAAKPVLKRDLFKDPVIIESIDVFKRGRDYLIRVRSKDGAEGIAVDNGRADILHPILTRLVAPCFINKDARDLEELLFAMYRQGDNYKYQGLALWVCVAAAEFALLDLLGKVSGKSVGDLFRKTMLTMPADDPGGLKPEQLADCLAYIFSKNKFPSGRTELPSDAEALKLIRIQPQK